ncbi:hypothetical protein AB0918_18780 [Streptomyces sp. NPDC006864]|uniref:hypothetical protein n=1 Tax=Streptomyces sp. NPDC006864 TaxID=3154780 RepID=UPI003451A353
MNPRLTRLLVPLLLTAAGAAGCSDNPGKTGTPAPGPDLAAVVAAARDHQAAALEPDWTRACGLRTERLRRGSVKDCADRNTAPTAAKESAVPPTGGPVYDDGSTALPQPSRTPGPDRADTGPVRSEGDPVAVPAQGDHPAGYGVLLSYTVTWPGKPASISRRAVRVVREGDAWRVDQYETVQPSDMAHSDPVRDALTGRR